MLTRQQAFGGWFDVNPYEQFRTPFRETQWALMALSSLYPNPKPRPDGWNGPLGPQPGLLRIGSPATLIRDLEQIWDVPAAELRGEIVAQLRHEAPMVRYAACRTLGRVGDGSAIAGLSKCLGDESKVVRRASADALRMIGNRLNGSVRPGQTEAQRLLVDQLRTALASPDDRTRRGATRVFAAHFRELSQELALADALLGRLDDPDPVVAMQAIKGLWRWWYWRSDPGLRNRIEDRLIAGLAEPRHPWVRRNLIEALYIIGDENIRYLDQNWIPSLARAEDRRRATDGQQATVNRLGGKYVDRPGVGQPAPARGRAPRHVGVLRAARARRPDRQRPGADALPRRHDRPDREVPDRPDVRPRPDDPTAGDPGPGDDPRRPIGRPGPVRLATAGRSRHRRPHLGRDDDQGVLP